MDGKSILDKVSSIKGQNPDDPNYQKRSATISGSIIGLAGGAYYGFAKKKNLLVTSLIGAVAGGIIARLFMPD